MLIEAFKKAKDSLILMIVGAVLSIVPFYFQTVAMTTENKTTNIEQSELLDKTEIRLHSLEVQGAIDNTEIKQIKESLNRIEEKIDKLIDRKE